MANNLLKQAQNAVNNFIPGQSTAKEKDAAQSAIQQAYTEATPEEQQQLQQLEQQLQQHNKVK